MIKYFRFEFQSWLTASTGDVDSLIKEGDEIPAFILKGFSYSKQDSFALIFIEAQRESLFPLYVEVSEKLALLFFALDQNSYASIQKCLSTSGT